MRSLRSRRAQAGNGRATSPRAARQSVARVIGALLMVWGTLIAVAGPASAALGFGVTPNFNNGLPVTVGDMN